ncbi:hypothetical protein B4109_0548 [Geobacillus stearothermophilus]|uniref:Uncharacterized protein n=1 Tax=Geobacillus stearothermophilus TaxID=1422 RepID=A0A150MRS4_GEOSE|nr:hypothetical protein B4109_0548 [Geobacillus stearothermophilus]
MKGAIVFIGVIAILMLMRKRFRYGCTEKEWIKRGGRA